MENSGFAEGYAVGMGNSDRNSGWGFGGDWIWAILLLAVFGYGGYGGGYGVGGGRGGSEMFGYQLGQVATTNDIASGFNNSAVLSSLNDIKLGQAQAINFNNQGFSGLNTALLTGFHGVDNAVSTLGYNMQTGYNAISREIGDWGCATQRAIDSINYNLSRSTCDIIRANQDNTREILNYLTSEKISSLQTENAGLKAQISNDKQSAYLLSQLKECPSPAYIVPNPNCCYNYSVNGYGYGRDCCGI